MKLKHLIENRWVGLILMLFMGTIAFSGMSYFASYIESHPQIKVFNK